MNGALDKMIASERHRHRRPFLIAAACAAVAGGAAVALLGVSGWFISAAAGAGLAGLASAHAFNYLLPSAAIRLLAIARTGARYGERLFGHEAALLTLARLRPALFAAIAGDDAVRALAVAKGEAATTLTQDTGTLEAWLVRRSSIWGAAAAAAVGVALIALTGWAPLVSTLGFLAVAMAGSLMLEQRLRSWALAVRHATGTLKEELALLAAARAELRCYGLEAWSIQRLEGLGQALAAAQRGHADRASRFEALQAVVTGLAVAAALWLARDAGAPLAALAGLAAAMTLEGVAPLNRHLLRRGSVDAAIDRLDKQLGRAAPQPLHDLALGVGTPALAWHRSVAICLAAGTRVALVGPSGSGKTRFVEQLIGLRAPEPSPVSIAGCDLASLAPTDLRARFAWLPQDAALLAGTVRENLALAHHAVDELSMWGALRHAALDRLVRSLPDGLDTWIGEDGSRLSGGERRRLGLARAYLGDAPWLLLDEPTEGLDAALEREVLAGLAARLKTTGQGLIVVTHRAAVEAFCHEVFRFGSDAPISPADQRRAALPRP